jgi:hypothetical protein
MNETELLITYAKAWNRLDTEFLKPILADDFEYTSQWVFETMYGKDKYMAYIAEKFESIKAAGNVPLAEVAFYRNIQSQAHKPCLLITQGEIKVALLIEIHDDKIKSADLVGIPNPNLAVELGIYPR